MNQVEVNSLLQSSVDTVINTAPRGCRTVREAARERAGLNGADAQALEGALQQCECELAASQEKIEKMKCCGNCGTDCDKGNYGAVVCNWTLKIKKGR